MLLTIPFWHEVSIAGIPLEFYLFALTLIGIALFHHSTMRVAVTGLVAIVFYKVFFTSFPLTEELRKESLSLINLFALLLGFGLLARHFQQSRLPTILPRYLPDNWTGGLLLLAITFVISSFLDNIAAAMIGGAMALSVYKGRVHIGFLAAIVAASNAGGSGSVIGDTTTTMMWIDGVHPSRVLDAYAGAVTAFLIFGIIAAIQQQKYSPIVREPNPDIKLDWSRILIVVLILIGAVITNVLADLPALGVWIVIIAASFFKKTDWHELRIALPGSVFLICLVIAASLMPVQALPPASELSAFVLGVVSSVFDNIPLTKLALDKGGYDWGVLAYCVGFGGSMIWFGSSAGVALTNLCPDGRSVGKWISKGWYVPLAYVVGFIVMLLLTGWHPEPLKIISK
jgi:Na+/H+ antiporter NhaD/arsenite permease-like protein